MHTKIRAISEDGMFINPVALVESLSELSYKNNNLYIENVSTGQIVEKYGTPCYVYSRSAIIEAYKSYINALDSIDHQVCYAVKACSNIAILNVLAKEGSGFDIVSVGELARVLKAGGLAEKIVYSGVGKTAKDIEYALEKGIGCFNVEAISEMDLIHDIATKMNKVANISLRVNPNVDAKTHPYISTGLKENKFGIMHEDAVEAYQYASQLDGLKVVGIDCHIGSQLTEIAPFKEAVAKMIDLIFELKEIGIDLEHIDLGGGLGVQYIDENVVTPAELMTEILPVLRELGLKVIFEPGRSIVANAGVLLTTVDVLKPNEHKNFAIVDAAMNDLIRPALYQSEMSIIPTLLKLSDQPKVSWDIVGAICETGDFLAKNRLLELEVGDVLAITGAGAYGFTMSSNYNTRPRACEIMIDDNEDKLIRKRETIEELYQNEII